MKKNIDFSVSKRCNEFIDSLKRNVHCIEVIPISDTETVIMYEDWEHEPIKNYSSVFQECRRSAEIRKHMGEVKKGKPKSPETKKKISEALKGREFSNIHKARISARKVQYYRNLKSGKESEIY